jgi:DEAD/DEAH box helicase domain-containing protein
LSEHRTDHGWRTLARQLERERNTAQDRWHEASLKTGELIVAIEKAERDLQAMRGYEQSAVEIAVLRERERDKVLEMITEINQRDLLNTMTDAGLIPNYAFPEAGVELKSVLWRRRAEGEEGEGRYVALKPLVYERPANSALSEFAPENRFYANQRRVEIDQVNVALGGAESWETWRLCANCHFARPVATGDSDVTCPRCGDAMWGDEAQKRTLLRFRQAIANSDETNRCGHDALCPLPPPAAARRPRRDRS